MNRTYNIIYILCLTLILLSPLLNEFLPNSLQFLPANAIAEEDEKITVRQFEILNPWKFTETFTSFYEKNFKGRQVLFHIYKDIMMDGFSTSPISRVSLGREKWLFLGKDDALKDYMRIKKLNTNDFIQIKEKLENQNQILDSLDIRYLVVVIPNKHTIYPEFLGERLVKAPSSSNLEILDSIMHASQVNFLNLTSVLSHAKENNDFLYYNSDSHWNDLGAFIGYNAICEKLRQMGFNKIDDKAYEKIEFLNKTNYYRNDLSRMLLSEDRYRMKTALIDSSSVQMNSNLYFKGIDPPKEYYNLPQLYSLQTKNPTKSYSIIFYRDSFTSHLTKYFSNNFGECWYLWQPNLDLEVIKKERPELVIQIVVERSLKNLSL